MLSIKIPKNINKIVINSSFIKIEGLYGTFIKKKSNNIKLYIDNDNIYLLDSTNSFFLSILQSLLLGASQGFYKKLKIVGIGNKIFLKDNKLILHLGFSHEVIFDIPKNISIFIQKPNILLICGNNLQKVGQIAFNIRNIKPSEPYKGIGISYIDEITIKKKGKKD